MSRSSSTAVSATLAVSGGVADGQPDMVAVRMFVNGQAMSGGSIHGPPRLALALAATCPD